MNIIERIDRPCEYVEVAQTALIACQYLYLWLFAGPDDAYKVYSLAILMAFEFVMVHSGLFMAAMPLNGFKYGCLFRCMGFLHCIWAFNAGGGLYNHHSLPCNCAQQNAFRFFSMSVNRSSSG
mgnify:CR=1 FL=1